MGQSSKHYRFFAADKANNLGVAQGTNSEADQLEARQGNNIAKLRSRQWNFSLYAAVKVQSEASYCRTKGGEEEMFFLIFSVLRMADILG